ncbi:hypothetical protein [Roseivirga sp.]|uniref:hypothetical protein n=1 Tax=Roseivirga sp. TaxID=1964215 RepID=UPI003B8B2668
MITNQQANEIRNFLSQENFTDKDLIDDLVDHISSEIELLLEDEKTSFDEAFELARRKTLPTNANEIEKDLKILTTKTPNIMIKKTAYIGGYLSALLFSLAILFTILSFQNESMTDSRRESMSKQYILMDIDRKISKEERIDIFSNYNKETALLNLKAIEQRSNSQMLLIISILLFGITFLPYKFYLGFKRSELQFN